MQSHDRKGPTMATRNDFCDAMLLSNRETEEISHPVERMVRPRRSSPGLAQPGCGPTQADVTGADWAALEARRTLARIAGTHRVAPEHAAARLGVTTAELEASRQDLWTVLSFAAQEVPALRAALVEGRIDGGTYYGECACLIGTIANARGCDVYSLGSLGPAPDRPIEHLFMRISRGDTPQSNPIARLIMQWIDEWRACAPESATPPRAN
jgi:hypothetical protein